MEENIIIEMNMSWIKSKTMKYDKYCKMGVMFLK